jgi:hypothetical protein
MHLRIEINLRDFQRLVAEPTLDFHQIETRPQPIRRGGFAQTVITRKATATSNGSIAA